LKRGATRATSSRNARSSPSDRSFTSAAAGWLFTFILVDWHKVQTARPQGLVDWLGTVLGSGLTGSALAPILRSIRQVARAGRHLELVNLVVPTLNDSEPMLKDLVKWVAGELGPDVPLHFTRFHPDYQLLDLPPTPLSSLERAWELAKAQGLHFVYIGNVPGHEGNHTRCPKCGALCMERKGFFIAARRMKGGACAACGTRLAGVWS